MQTSYVTWNGCEWEKGIWIQIPRPWQAVFGTQQNEINNREGTSSKLSWYQLQKDWSFFAQQTIDTLQNRNQWTAEREDVTESDAAGEGGGGCAVGRSSTYVWLRQ